MQHTRLVLLHGLVLFTEHDVSSHDRRAVCADLVVSLLGFNLTVGGGMGRTHRNNDTFPRIADPFCYVDKDDIFHAQGSGQVSADYTRGKMRRLMCKSCCFPAAACTSCIDSIMALTAKCSGLGARRDTMMTGPVKAIVATQRDYGRRDDRRQARLKYLIHEWGLEKFRCELMGLIFHSLCAGYLRLCLKARATHPALLCRSVVEQYYGKKFEAFKPMPKWEFFDYLGWGEQGDGKLFYGVYVQAVACSRPFFFAYK
eukprot:712141-Pelagomonas_calceolata.AAC.1